MCNCNIIILIIVNYLKSACSLCTEIIKEVKRNGNDLTGLLQAGVNQLEPNCLNEALIAAVHNDHHHNVGKLIVRGASNIIEALKLSVNEKKACASAMLMLVYAAMEGNCNLIRQLFGEIKIEEQPCEECARKSGRTYEVVSQFLDSTTIENCDECFLGMRGALKSSDISTAIPIEISRRCVSRNTHTDKAQRCAHVREELLMKTDVNEEEKYVYWHGLSLHSLDLAWLQRIRWVKTLMMGQNQLSTLPDQMGMYLQQVGSSFCCNVLFSQQCLHKCMWYIYIWLCGGFGVLFVFSFY